MGRVEEGGTNIDALPMNTPKALVLTLREEKEKADTKADKLQAQIAELQSLLATPASLTPPNPSATKPLDIDDPEVTRIRDDNFLLKNMITNNCSFSAKIHTSMSVLLDALFGDQTSTTKGRLYQEVVKNESNGAIVTYWGFMLNQVTPCDMILRLATAKDAHDDNEFRKLLEFATLTLSIGVVFLASLFFLLINKEYRSTFLSTLTAKQFRRNQFFNGDDEKKAIIFAVHKSFIVLYIDQVEKWVKASWGRWEKEKPEWFNDEFREIVPEDMKPKRREREGGGGEEVGGRTSEKEGINVQRRRKSLFEKAIARRGGSNKVSPAGRNEGSMNMKINVEEFERELSKRGSGIFKL
ncbi:hypothetical protein TrLO_g11602 [Triparma laevis f. longispina]|uniref:Uncharacterized protein n=1 Tax=Triparma laevis f. longispina TaxID=1714387 RepID=A0A9W7F9P7_9STRA|nr:hypothetical protein TrLO_g11602 [Triparma laevis f. longispina]